MNSQSRTLCAAWPANVLIPLLQNIFEDGELDQSEMHVVAQALADIETHWQAAQPPEEAPAAPATKQPGITELRRQFLQPVDHQTEMESSDGETRYLVDLRTNSCMCPDWIAKRRAAPSSDFKRLCKRMASLYGALEIAEESGGELFGAFIDDYRTRGKGTHPSESWFVEEIGGREVLYGYSGSSEWINVFAPTGGRIERFGYNKDESRWSYGESPKALARALRQTS